MFGFDAIERTIELEWVPGASLDSGRDEDEFSTLTERQTALVWRDITAGLAWIHGRNIIHKDVKPSNIMWDAVHGRSVLIDFGLGGKEIDGYFLGGGTPWYVAPDHRVRQSSCAGDVWSFGVTLLYCLKVIPLPEKTAPWWDLKKAFGNTQDLRTMTEWLVRLRKLRSTIPNRHRVLSLMLENDPTERISAKALVDELRQSGVVETSSSNVENLGPRYPLRN